MGRKYVILWILSSPKIQLRTKSKFFSCLTPLFLQKVLGPILRLPETLLTFSTSAKGIHQLAGSVQQTYDLSLRDISQN